MIVFGCSEVFDDSRAVFFPTKACRRFKNSGWALECTLTSSRVLPTCTSTHWAEEHRERKSGWGGYSLFLQVESTFHLGKKQIMFCFLEVLPAHCGILVFFSCSKFIIRVVKGFELGIYHHVSACPSRAASGLGEASKDLQSLFVGTGYQQNIPGTHYHLMFSSLLALASWGFHNSDFFFFIMLQE